jgi:SAM-dependent methyltransferase
VNGEWSQPLKEVDSVQPTTVRALLLPAATSTINPEEQFELLLRRLIRQGDLVLDAGCGSGKFYVPRGTDGKHFLITGIDRLGTVAQNCYVDLRVGGNVNELPFCDGSFDVVYARWLVEHLREPEIALREFHRVLKSGGRLALFTTNLLHYYGVAAKLTPHWFHLWFNRRIRGFEESDIFPTYYRANTRGRVIQLLRSAGFQQRDVEVRLAEGAPTVLEFDSMLHRVGRTYECIVKRFEALAPLRTNIIAIARKE